jgi:hypothetical protein
VNDDFAEVDLSEPSGRIEPRWFATTQEVEADDRVVALRVVHTERLAWDQVCHRLQEPDTVAKETRPSRPGEPSHAILRASDTAVLPFG